MRSTKIFKNDTILMRIFSSYNTLCCGAHSTIGIHWFYKIDHFDPISTAVMRTNTHLAGTRLAFSQLRACPP